jgi:hypothetical protein
MINREFSDKSTGTTPANGYKPVMIVDTIDHPATKSGFKRKFLATMKFIFKFIIWTTALVILIAAVAAFLLFGVAEIKDRSFSNTENGAYNTTNEAAMAIANGEMITAEKNIKNYQKQLLLLIPKTPYLIINTTDNEFDLYSGDKLIRKGRCSTGKNTILQRDDQKRWVFKTPRGAMRIRGKITNPVWVKPDWAFVEEGLPVPSARHPSRYEAGSLGDYALSLGDGYMIHGTLYKRLLGMPVTHGCIRMNDEDLEVIYNTLNIGSKVYIY